VSSDKYKLFTGLVCIQVRRDATGLFVDQNNESWYGWYLSEEAALGDFVKRTTKKFPNGSIVFSAAYDISDAIGTNPNVK